MAIHQDEKASGSKRTPRQIKVGNKRYKITMVKGLETAEGAALLGLHSPSLRQIFIEKGLQPGHMAEVVLHEVMHAVATDYYGVNPAKAGVEEFYINNLALGVVKVFRDNPRFFSWWSYLMCVENTNNA